MSVIFQPILPIHFNYLYNKDAYLRLRNSHSETCKTVIFTSHNSKMTCFLESIVDPKVLERYREIDAHILPNREISYRFKNCAVLSVRIRRNCLNAIIDLVHSGYADDYGQNYMYFCKKGEESNPKDRIFEIQELPLKCLGLDLMCVTFDMEILIVRHGEAEHNLSSYFNKPADTLTENTIGSAIKENKIDTELTSRGKEQARKVGEFLVSYITEISCMKTNKIDLAFCTVLRRTRQTLEIILNTMAEKSNTVSNLTKMIIAPCSREVLYGNVAGCFIKDSDPAYLDNPDNKSELRFNQPICSYLNKSIDDLSPECNRLSNYQIDPKYFIEYHQNSKCSGFSSDMIKIIVDCAKKEVCQNK